MTLKNITSGFKTTGKNPSKWRVVILEESLQNFILRTFPIISLYNITSDTASCKSALTPDQGDSSFFDDSLVVVDGHLHHLYVKYQTSTMNLRVIQCPT